MSHAILKVATKLILFNDNGEVLALEAQSNGPMSGYYDLPGGRMDEDEIGKPFSEIIAREVVEELGEINYELDPRPVTALSWVWPNGQAITFIYYQAKFINGELIISDEHISYKWVKLSHEEWEKHFTTYHKEALKNLIN